MSLSVDSLNSRLEQINAEFTQMAEKEAQLLKQLEAVKIKKFQLQGQYQEVKALIDGETQLATEESPEEAKD